MQCVYTMKPIRVPFGPNRFYYVQCFIEYILPVLLQWVFYVQLYNISLADPRGAPGTRPPPGGPNSFIFMQFSAKMWKIIAILGVGAPPGENPGPATAYHLKSIGMVWWLISIYELKGPEYNNNENVSFDGCGILIVRQLQELFPVETKTILTSILNANNKYWNLSFDEHKYLLKSAIRMQFIIKTDKNMAQ